LGANALHAGASDQILLGPAKGAGLYEDDTHNVAVALQAFLLNSGAGDGWAGNGVRLSWMLGQETQHCRRDQDGEASDRDLVHDSTSGEERSDTFLLLIVYFVITLFSIS
jgi:hypothetical protein